VVLAAAELEEGEALAVGTSAVVAHFMVAAALPVGASTVVADSMVGGGSTADVTTAGVGTVAGTCSFTARCRLSDIKPTRAATDTAVAGGYGVAIGSQAAVIGIAAGQVAATGTEPHFCAKETRWPKPARCQVWGLTESDQCFPKCLRKTACDASPGPMPRATSDS